MYKVSKEHSVRTVKIYIGKLLGLESDNDCFITLKEIPTMAFMELAKVQSKLVKGDSTADKVEEQVELFKFFYDHFSELLADHNLMIDDKTPADANTVRDIMFGSLRFTMKMISEYSNAGLLNT